MRFAALLLLPALSACNADEKIADGTGDDGMDVTPSDDGAGDGGTTDGECANDDACGSGQICESGACVDGDRNNSVDEAENLLFGDVDDPSTFGRGTLNPAGDIDYFVIHADGGEFIRVATYTDEEDDTKDTVVTILKDNGKVVTSANGFAAGGGVGDADSVVYAYLSDAGDYFVKVEDDGTYFESGDEFGSRDYTYDIVLTEWSSVTAEPDASDDPRTGISITGANSWSSRGALIGTAGDVDYIALSVEADGFDLSIDGNYDLEGSDIDPHVRLVDAATGDVLLDRRQNGLYGNAVFWNIPRGSYWIEVSDAEGGGGDNHWMFVHTIARTHDDNYQWESEDNGVDVRATPVDFEALTTDSGNEYTVARIEGMADAPGDEDWFSVQSDFDDGRLVVCLNSTWFGATTAPVLEAYDDSGTLLATITGETDSAAYPTATFTNVSAPTGTYYLRVAHPTDVVGGPGDFYRALVYVASFDVTSYDCP